VGVLIDSQAWPIVPRQAYNILQFGFGRLPANMEERNWMQKI